MSSVCVTIKKGDAWAVLDLQYTESIWPLEVLDYKV